MKKAIISLSFDDGRSDNLAVFQDILVPLSIPATINITTGYVDGSCRPELQPSSKPAITINELQHLAKKPLVEIALHGDMHLNTVSDIAKGREKLICWLGLPENCVLGFASPGSGLPVESFVDSDTLLFTKHISYLRTSLRIKKYRGLRILCRKIGRVIHIPVLYRIAYADTLMSSCEDRVVYSIPVMKDTTYAQLKAIIDLAIRRRCALTIMFHSILECVDGEDNWSWDKKEFMKLCQYLKGKACEGVLEVMTTKAAFHALQG